MGNFPILSNGNVSDPADVEANLNITGADGIMSAEGLLDNPALMMRRFRSSGSGASSSSSRSSSKSGGSSSGASSAVTASVRSAGGTAEGGTAEGGTAESAGEMGADAAKEVRKLSKKLREILRLEGAALTRGLQAAELNKIAQKRALEARVLELGGEPISATTGDEVGAAAGPVGGDAVAVGGSGGSTGRPGHPEMALEYLKMCDRYPSATLSSQVFHVRRICREILNERVCHLTTHSKQNSLNITTHSLYPPLTTVPVEHYGIPQTTTGLVQHPPWYSPSDGTCSTPAMLSP
jgi:hypothetical protein